MRALLFGWVLFSIAGCGDGAARSSDAGACRCDTGLPPDAGAPQDSGELSDGGSTGDAGDVSRGYMTYVPPGLMPTEAARMIVMGDSISAGSGASDGSLTYFALLHQNDDAEWPAATAEDLESKFGTAPALVSVARGGATTTTLRNAQVDALRRELDTPVTGHSIVVITIGGNDMQSAIIGGDPTGALLEEVIANIRAVIEALQDPTDFPDGTSIYLMNVYDPSDGVAQIDGCFFGLSLPQLVAALDVWKERYVELGTELGFAVIDAHGRFHGHGFYFDDPENPFYDAADPTHWFDDCIHPNDRGHHEIRRLFFEAIDR